MIQGIKLEFYLICRGKGIRVGVHGKISSTRLLLTPKSIFSERKKDSTTKVKRKGFISYSRALVSSLEEINKCLLSLKFFHV